MCVLPGTELSFAYEVKRSRLWPWTKNIIHHKTAVFRQVNLANPNAHHDALEFPNGDIVLLTYLMEGQEATVLQLPATGLGPRLRSERLTFNGAHGAFPASPRSIPLRWGRRNSQTTSGRVRLLGRSSSGGEGSPAATVGRIRATAEFDRLAARSVPGPLA